jgi:glycosyltransferase involved in cell wall biosynthesis
VTGAVTPDLVSIVVTSYNHARFLARRMDSLILQTYPHIEILVIDDCSTENNVEILRRYEAHPSVRLVLRQQNAGLVPVMNQGIEMASGEFILIAQCDDDCDPRMVERLVGALTRQPTAGMAFCRSLMVDEQDRVVGNDFSVRERSFRSRCAADTLLSGAEMSRFLLTACVIPNLSALLMRRACLATVGNLSGAFAVCVDWELFFRVAARYDVAYVAEPLNRFRQHENTIRSLTTDRVTYEEFLRLLLGQIRVLDLTPMERCRFRTHAMFLWGVHLLSPSRSGLKNLPYHLNVVIRHDPLALFFFGPGVLWRAVQVVGKLVLGRPRHARAS